MKQKLLFALACWSQICWAAGEGVAQPPSPIPPANRSVSVKDVSPPVPIVKDIVDAVVNEQRAVILTPEQIEAIKKTTSDARKTEPFQYPNQFIAKPVVRRIYIDPADAAKQREPKMVRLAMGTVSAIVFSDVNGNPWYVSNVSLDCSQFTDGVTCGQTKPSQPSSPTNIVKLQPLKPYAYGNIMIELEGMTAPIPVILMLSTGQSGENDIRIDAMVNGRNPNARAQIIQTDRMPTHDQLLSDILDGVIPPGARRLAVSGAPAEAWSVNGKLYLRTRLAVLSPAFTDHAGSADGMHVYKFFSLIPNLLASDAGRETSLFITGY